MPTLPAANLKEPGWQVQRGQAVWHLPDDKPELAGDVLLATRANGESFVEFSKTPFPVMVGQTRDNRWSVRFPAEKKHYAGYGKPPSRIIWLQLPRVLNGASPPDGWKWRDENRRWRLENTATGEFIDGYFEEGT